MKKMKSLKTQEIKRKLKNLEAYYHRINQLIDKYDGMSVLVEEDMTIPELKDLIIPLNRNIKIMKIKISIASTTL